VEPVPGLRVLCVDDEPNVLEGLRRHLRRHCEVHVAEGGRAGLELIEREGPFAVVTSDLRMPEMDGVTFLGRVCALAPDTVRVLLTGNADIGAAVAAVNEGSIFRFLTKPCPPEVLLKAIASAAEQHRLITAERVLLEQTLHGSVKALTDVLALANPAAFGRATRAKQQVSELTRRLGVSDAWQVEVAAMLSQIGCVTLPPEVADKLYHGAPLGKEELAMVERLPAIAERLLENIPRLDAVRDSLRHQSRHFDGGPRAPGPGPRIPLGARLLKVVLDFDLLEAQGLSAELALDTMRGREGWYDPTVLEALVDSLGSAGAGAEVRELALKNVRRGMTFAEDVTTRGGLLLIARGQEVTEGLIERIHNFSPTLGVREPVRVFMPKPAASPGPPAASSSGGVEDVAHGAAGR
jgi:response regulator RpfG family c-di-GMP phosphodiesterase